MRGLGHDGGGVPAVGEGHHLQQPVVHRGRHKAALHTPPPAQPPPGSGISAGGRQTHTGPPTAQPGTAGGQQEDHQAPGAALGGSPAGSGGVARIDKGGGGVPAPAGAGWGGPTGPGPRRSSAG